MLSAKSDKFSSSVKFADTLKLNTKEGLKDMKHLSCFLRNNKQDISLFLYREILIIGKRLISSYFFK